MLESLNLLPVYDSSEHDIVQDLIVPLLSNSRQYLRGVGFFTSGWLTLASRGLIDLIQNGGRGWFVVSPVLDEADWEALKLGDAAKMSEFIKDNIRRQVTDLAWALKKEVLLALAWMVSDGLLDFKLAVTRDRHSGGDYHDKVGVFIDESGARVAIHGSFNDTVKGSLNYEAFSVFRSWKTGEMAHVEWHEKRLRRLLENKNHQIEVFSIGEALREMFVQVRPKGRRPYKLPHLVDLDLPDTELKCPIVLREYQQMAIERWTSVGCRGIFEMATGTGKTITALAAACRCFEHNHKIVVIILVPFLHLLEQWDKAAKSFGFVPILCSGVHHNWRRDVKSAIQDFNLGTRNHVCLIVTHESASYDKFDRFLTGSSGKFALLIGDEVHGLGAEKRQLALLPSAESRLGLSATPMRWYDEKGTSAIFAYFGKICYEMPLEEAISKGFLTPYMYYPVLVHLSPMEISSYEEITAQIVKLQIQSNTQEDQEILSKCLIRRARILAAAEQKLPQLKSILEMKMGESKALGRSVKHSLIYCAPGTHRKILREVANMGLRCREFVHTVNLADRKNILDLFSTGDIQVLVAVKCLDEGVDVPATQQAFLLASTSNPREFVQRRGRVLRIAHGKNRAEIYDFVVFPDPHSAETSYSTAKSLLHREMGRFAEFSSGAINKFSARNQVRDLLNHYGMLHLLNQRPWEIYKQTLMGDEENVNLSGSIKREAQEF